ncbi:MAG: recombination protein O N-terminal domain-containing protein [Treponema sp.]|nr:recombination protein O N-terminal domain-containing protein [Treponema sp.]
MTRNLTYSALTLRVKPSGESNREAWFLTAEEGLIRATVFGGAKSRFRALVSPFHQGKLWIYRDPVKDSRKVNDFDVQVYRPGIREMWERVICANAIAETILSTGGGGGSWPQALELAGNVLNTLEGAGAGSCSRIGVYFLWNWLRLLGLGPELSASCTCRAKPDAVLWYSQAKQEFFCEICAREITGSYSGRSGLNIGPACVKWLKSIENISPAALIEPDASSLEQAKTLCLIIMAEALGRRLPCLEEI